MNSSWEETTVGNLKAYYGVATTFERPIYKLVWEDDGIGYNLWSYIYDKEELLKVANSFK